MVLCLTLNPLATNDMIISALSKFKFKAVHKSHALFFFSQRQSAWATYGQRKETHLFCLLFTPISFFNPEEFDKKHASSTDTEKHLHYRGRPFEMRKNDSSCNEKTSIDQEGMSILELCSPPCFNRSAPPPKLDFLKDWKSSFFVTASMED